MKPRQQAAPLTEEDSFVWFLVVTRFQCPGRAPFGAVWGRSIGFDRHDAELMWRAQSNRYCALPPDWPDAIYVEDPPMLGPMVFVSGPVGGQL